jgi:predicted O-methyltransferase YrrM
MTLRDVIADVDAACRQREVHMLGPQKAARLAELVRQERPHVVVEVGTAIGYSGLWIAEALRELGQGRLLTFEQDAGRAAEAHRNFERAGVTDLITQYVGDARELLKEVPGPIDLLFLDGGFENYHPCLLACRGQLRDGALLVADNVHIGAAEMADYLAWVRGHCESRTEWFDSDVPWHPHDALEMSRYRARETAGGL